MREGRPNEREGGREGKRERESLICLLAGRREGKRERDLASPIRLSRRERERERERER